MAIPPDVRATAEVALAGFCASHSAAPGADPLRYVYEFESNAVVLIEQRPGFVNREEWVSRPVARLRYSEARNTWSLYWSDANRRWHRVPNTTAAKDIESVLQQIVTDSTGVFWS